MTVYQEDGTLIFMTNTKYEVNFRSGFDTQDNWKAVEMVSIGKGKYGVVEFTVNGAGPAYTVKSKIRKVV